MLRATAIFTVFVACLAAGAVLAQSVTAVRAIRSQSLIGADDVTLDDATVPGGVAELAAVVGREARVTLYPGRPILAAQLGPPALVERNQLVRMVFQRGPLTIGSEGRALDRGGVGERIRVMNLGSRQIVTGAVTEEGGIEVGE
jgi:flagella basal body P-ring formation protein FlgA